MKRIMMRMVEFGTLAAVVVAVLVVLGSLSGDKVVRVAYAVPSCSINTAVGTYSGAWAGTTGGQWYDASEVSTFSVSGPTGNFSANLTYSTGGSSATTTESGTYTVSSNCTGTLTLDDGLTLAMVILPSQTEIQFAETDGSGLMANTEKKITGTCTLSTVAHTYAGAWTGYTGGVPYDASEVSIFSVVSSTGHFSGSLTYSVGGSSGTLTETGTYTLGSNCIGTLTLSDGLTFALVAVPSLSEIQLAETDGSGIMANTEKQIAFAI